MEENKEDMTTRRFISGKEMMEREISMLENEKGYSEKLALYTIEELSSIGKRIDDCLYLSEAREIEKTLQYHYLGLKKIEPKHNFTSINSVSYKSDDDFNKRFNKELSDRIKWFDDAMKRLSEKIASGKLKKAPELKSLGLSSISYGYIKNLYEYLADKAIIKNEGEITRESLDYAITGRKPKENWSYTPITLLASKQELRFILSYLINGNQLGSLSNEVKRRAGNLFVKDGAPIGELSNLSKKVKEEREAYKGIDHHREFFSKMPI